MPHRVSPLCLPSNRGGSRLRLSWSTSSVQQSLEKALTGIRLDPQDNRCHSALVLISLFRREYDLAEHHAHQAIALNPNDADEIALLGHVMTVRGRPEDALLWFEKAKRLNPFHPPFYHAAEIGAFFLLHRYREAVQACKLVPGLSPHSRSRLAASYARLGDMTEARAQVAALLQERPSEPANTSIEILSTNGRKIEITCAKD
jgi:adenylate cyclase